MSDKMVKSRKEGREGREKMPTLFNYWGEEGALKRRVS
jgi:hypothetical protein